MPDSNWKLGECVARPLGPHSEKVSIGETRIVERIINGKKRTVEEREVREVRYKDWDGRCRACFP